MPPRSGGKVADLRKLERVLDEMAAECDGGEVPECPIIDALYQERGIGGGVSGAGLMVPPRPALSPGRAP